MEISISQQIQEVNKTIKVPKGEMRERMGIKKDEGSEEKKEMV